MSIVVSMLRIPFRGIVGDDLVVLEVPVFEN